ncbi:type II secretion system protein PulP [Pelotalea chapellei]|uniref:Type II secretion system protein PulP n=1 Tax=Pelotalea chapellei TaxID=44671 RepID=A0ABS5U6Z6_9BACT|nr:type II secretion system protein PulP [Pelotalea chapellei]MBT1071437.1 type II secretion system protein PulP [Pelotalea chapellei]
MNRQRLLLFILLILFVLAIAWALFNRPQQKTVNTLKNAPGQQPGNTKPKLTAQTGIAPRYDGKKLRLDLLEHDQQTFAGYHRNLFKPIFVDEVKLMQRKAAAVKPVLPPPQAPKPPVQPPPPPVSVGPLPDTPQRELGRFTFLGFLKKDNQKTVFLAKDKDIILVKKGESFAGRYQALSVTDQALTILVKDTGEEIVIPLLENRPLNMAVR